MLDLPDIKQVFPAWSAWSKADVVLQEEPDEDTMARVKVLYCRNLTANVTEEDLK